MSQKKIYIAVSVIFILAFLAGNLVYPKFLNLPYLPDIPFKLGLDLQGGIHLVYEADMSGIEAQEYGSSLQGLRDVLERRVNLFGVKEPTVQTQESGDKHRLIVELAGISDPAEAIKIIGQMPYLEFKEYKTNYQEITAQNSELMKNEGKVEVQLADPFQPTSLTGKYLKKAELNFDQTTYQPLVSLQFDDEGAKIFEELTARNIGKPLAIYIDGLPISAPVVQDKIADGNAQITGRFSVPEARDLANNLNQGALPVPISLISQRSVGATLGIDSLNKMLKAGLIGFGFIAVFMILYYRLGGLFSVLALLIYVPLVLTIFKLLPVTLTLSGIAGFLLSMGMAVDANILILERIKEEVREGKAVATAVKEGFLRAWPSIRDSNASSIITSLVLYYFTTSIVRGFALTLLIGVLVSMFSAIFVSRTLILSFLSEKTGHSKFWFHA